MPKLSHASILQNLVLMIVFIWLIKYVVAIVKVMNLIGDVKGKVAVMMDDMIDTAGKPFLIVLKHHCCCCCH